jgi:ABC-type nitrate/sulfonate/bicarbonate transport system ATPase subunit
MVTEAALRETRQRAAIPQIEAAGIEKSFGSGEERHRVLDSVSVSAAPGEFVSIIGPSGCGKSTLLSILTGLVRPDRGEVRIAGQDVTGRVGLTGYMPQKELLLPWRTVLDNTAIALELKGRKRSEARREAAAWFPRFGLEGYERAYPSALSGGMRQRAALLRTVLTGRDILLLDEPLGALDAITRMDMQQWLLDVAGSLGKTIILVTHDVDEALYLSDRAYVLSPRPGTVRAVIDVAFSRPRRHDEVVTSATFAHLKRDALRALRGDL